MSKPVLEFSTTPTYDKSFVNLTSNLQKRTLEKLALYEKNPRHPSLRIKKLEGTRDIWEMRVTSRYRMTFQRRGAVVLLRNIGTHAILKQWAR